MTSNRRALGVTLVTLVLCCFGLIYWLFHACEPIYAGQPLSNWVTAFSVGRDRTPPADAVRALKAIGQRALPYLVEWLEPHRGPVPEVPLFHIPLVWRVRSPAPSADAVLEAFKVLGPQGEPAVPKLLNLLRQSHNYASSHNAATALCLIGTPALPRLIDAMDDAHPRVKEEILCRIALQGTNAIYAVQKVSKYATGVDQRLRAQALRVIGFIGGDPQMLIPLLKNSLTSSNTDIREAAAEGFAGFGKSAVAEIPDLIVALNDPDPAVRSASVDSLGTICERPDVTVPALCRLSGDRDADVRRAIVLALENFEGQLAVGTIRNMTSDPDTSVREEAVSSLKRKSQTEER